MMNRMLTSETKKKIDSARDILVGKIPDPKAQVDQITTALIYKFMDDMDQESVEIGGKRRYFIDDYEKYAWHKIMDPKLGAQDRMNLYTEAITKFQNNPNLPALFRNIFKDAFLPFRNPETLTLFLKQIDEFNYDHSENLGDAYEYLLSIMGSQGDAGQFRTPRHIIDFMVQVVDPKKEDKILDPACGTAGFLISAYKHILAQHDGKDDVTGEPTNKEKLLTPQEKSQITKNFVGYDISPDMVRISEVNMFLHDFTEPKIYEYDTLSSEEKWDEKFDVMLANPPFMSPRGGIRPHKRFEIQANRSEVLFVDYIIEHLKPKGRAGIIVPEGIIFQSANAYKAIRKKLVEDGLFCVVSLPAGVFQPYSGVKTSILLFDNEVSKKSDNLLFIKVENDGYDLGAQRKPTPEKSDLPTAVRLIKAFQRNPKVSKDQIYEEAGLNRPAVWDDPNFAWNNAVWGGGEEVSIVRRDVVVASGDYNLNGTRYASSERSAEITGKWPMVTLVEVCERITDGSHNPPKEDLEGKEYMLSSQNINDGKINFRNARKISLVDFKKEDKRTDIHAGDVLITIVGTIGRVSLVSPDTPKFTLQRSVGVLKPKQDIILSKYLAYVMSSREVQEELASKAVGVAQKGVYLKTLSLVLIPLPPIEIQRKIIEEVNGYQRIIDGARQVIDSYKTNINYGESWPRKKMGDIVEINKETKDPSKEFGSDRFTYIDISAVGNGTGEISFDNKIKGNEAPSRARRVVHDGDILISTVRPNLQAFAYVQNLPMNSLASTGFAVLTPKSNEVDGKYLYYASGTATVLDQMVSKMGRGSYPSINQNDIENIEVPTPSLDDQKRISSQIEEERRIVSENRKIIEIFEQKIKDRVSELWIE